METRPLVFSARHGAHVAAVNRHHLTVALFQAADCIEKYERWEFCFVIAWLFCALFPLGTVLGVFTIIQLGRSDVKKAFFVAANFRVKMEDFRNSAGD